MVFHWSFSDSKSPRVSQTLLRIQADLNVVVCMGSIFPLIYNSFSLLSKYFRTVPSESTKIIITVTLIFPSVFSSQARSKYHNLLGKGGPVLKQNPSICLSLCFLLFSHSDTLKHANPLDDQFFLPINYP